MPRRPLPFGGFTDTDIPDFDWDGTATDPNLVPSQIDQTPLDVGGNVFDQPSQQGGSSPLTAKGYDASVVTPTMPDEFPPPPAQAGLAPQQIPPASQYENPFGSGFRQSPPLVTMPEPWPLPPPPDMFGGVDFDAGFRPWLGLGAPTGAREFLPGMDPSRYEKGSLGYQPTGPWEERWKPWDAPTGMGNLWKWGGDPAPTGSTIPTEWQLAKMAEGAGPYEGPRTLFSPQTADRVADVETAIEEYGETPYAERGSTIGDWQSGYNQNVARYRQAQEAERSRSLSCISAGGTPIVDENGRFMGCDMPEVEIDDPPPPPPNGEDPPPPPLDNKFPGVPPIADTGIIPPVTGLSKMVSPEWEDLSTIPVGEDPLSALTNLSLEEMLRYGGTAPTPLAGEIQYTLENVLGREGAGALETTPLGEDVQSTLQELIARGGAMPEDQQRRAMEIEAARSPLDMMRQAQMEQGQAALASRNLLGQGPELDYMQRLEQGLAPMYAQAGQQIALAERAAADQRYQQALQQGGQFAQQADVLQENRLSNAMSLATGMSQEQSRNVLATAQTVGERQQMLSEIALASLGQNMEWNKFLAEYGITRDQALETIQQGRFDAILPLLQNYMEMAGLAAQGYAAGETDPGAGTTAAYEREKNY